MTAGMTPSETLAETVLATRPRPAPRKPKGLTRIGAALAAAVAALGMLVTSASPVQAGNQDLARALAGVAAVVIVGSLLDGVGQAKAAPIDVPVQVRSGDRDDDDRMSPYDRRHGPSRKRHESRAPVLPGTCAMQIDGGHRRSVIVYPERCLRRTGFDRRLPEHCANVYRNGRRTVAYEQKCLINEGFRTDRRRY